MAYRRMKPTLAAQEPWQRIQRLEAGSWAHMPCSAPSTYLLESFHRLSEPSYDKPV